MAPSTSGVTTTPSTLSGTGTDTESGSGADTALYAPLVDGISWNPSDSSRSKMLWL
ncbi:MAG: hypothetical protein J07HQX50_02328 [Haloquadratum sp. J07HQX50]|nr:MAG: hypothetical protein J07HQX50_02328 [Haloquadratum sp. J07HQX50]